MSHKSDIKYMKIRAVKTKQLRRMNGHNVIQSPKKCKNFHAPIFNAGKEALVKSQILLDNEGSSFLYKTLNSL